MARITPFLLALCALPLSPCALAVAATAEADPALALADLGRWIEQLDDEQFDVRRQAGRQIEALLAREELGPALAAEFQRVLARPDVSFEVRWQLERWSRQLPAAPAPAIERVTPEEVGRLIDQLADDAFAARVAADHRLEASLLRDDNLPVVVPLLKARLAEKPGAELAASLGRLLELTRPAMVAECWENRRHVSEQYLLIGVPSIGPGATRASHFDRIDDHTAHCVSGSSLSPGDYPVGVAIPHPNDPNAFFRLVNLPTPRRRREYSVERTKEDAPRLAALSRPTLETLLTQRRPLSTRELLLLWQLDADEVSRFAGKYFLAVDDTPMINDPELAATVRDRTEVNQPSVFGMICAALVTHGTKAASPGLLSAIEKDRFLPPTAAAPARLHWVAALAIAKRDPWPGVDEWLARVVARDDLLSEHHPPAFAAELGATAAALLLERHGRPIEPNGPSRAIAPMAVDGYRFASPADRTKFERWWQEESKKPRPRSPEPGVKPP